MKTYCVVVAGRYIVNGTWKQWWSSNTAKGFKEQVKQCFLDYYSNQTAGPYLIDGNYVTVSHILLFMAQ